LASRHRPTLLGSTLVVPRSIDLLASNVTVVPIRIAAIKINAMIIAADGMKIDRDLVIVNIGIGNDGDHAAIVLRNTSRTIATTKKQFDCSLVIYRSLECTCRRKNDFVTGCSCVQRRGISSDGVCGTRIYRK